LSSDIRYLSAIVIAQYITLTYELLQNILISIMALKPNIKINGFSKINIAIFALIFAGFGVHAIFSSHAATLPGDINNDGTVNITDLSLLLSSYGANTSSCTTNTSYTCDLNTNGTVDVFDLSIILSHYGTNATSSPFVTRQGTNLMLNGSPFRFTGFNIYDANTSYNQSWGQCGGNWNDGTKLDQALTDMGPHTSVIRAWFFQMFATTNTGARDWSRFDKTLAVAAQHNVKVVVTLSDQWNSCDGLYKGQSWYTSDYKNTIRPGDKVSYRDYVQEITAHYKDNPTIAMWQLMNEAEASTSSGVCYANGTATLKTWATDVSGLIKSTDPNHLVSLGTMGGGQCGIDGASYKDLHSVSTIDLCEYHDYGGDNIPLPSDLQADITACNQLGKPLFVGEAGITSASTVQDRATLYDNKLAAQFPAGIQGYLAWAWTMSSAPKDYGITTGDPLVAILAKYP
jgi:mannan endo-1,4-beta-mannosidase